MHASVKGFYGAEEKGQALAPRCAGWCARPVVKFTVHSAVTPGQEVDAMTALHPSVLPPAARPWLAAPSRRPTWRSTDWHRRAGWVRAGRSRGQHEAPFWLPPAAAARLSATSLRIGSAPLVARHHGQPPDSLSRFELCSCRRAVLRGGGRVAHGRRWGAWRRAGDVSLKGEQGWHGERCTVSRQFGRRACWPASRLVWFAVHAALAPAV